MLDSQAQILEEINDSSINNRGNTMRYSSKQKIIEMWKLLRNLWSSRASKASMVSPKKIYKKHSTNI